METDRPGFFSRLWLGIVLFWKLLFDAAAAARVRAALRPPGGPAELQAEPVPAEQAGTAGTPAPPLVVNPPQPAGPDPTPAMQLLSIMQREGRLLDFLQEDVTTFSDAEVGAAARVVHEGCNRALRDYLVLEPVRPEPEGAPITLEPGFDPADVRVTGKVVGQPPYRGRLAHHGWKIADIRLPTLASGHDPKVVAPAEVEL